MRTRILTPKDRDIITVFLDSGLKLEGFHVFVNRLKKADLSVLKEDLELVERFSEKLSKL